jgi:hydroxymethylglutaryl-CoA synthase
MQETGLKPADFDYVVFHQPNTKFPQRIGKELGFNPEQIKTGLLSPVIGNTYSGAAMIGLTAILDEAEPGQKILMVSYGSGAGSDAFVLETTTVLKERQGLAKKTQNYIARRVEIDYATYVRYRGEIVVK